MLFVYSSLFKRTLFISKGGNNQNQQFNQETGMRTRDEPQKTNDGHWNRGKEINLNQSGQTPLHRLGA